MEKKSFNRKENECTDLVMEAERIINAKFESMNQKPVEKRTGYDIALNICMMGGCLLLVGMMVFMRW